MNVERPEKSFDPHHRITIPQGQMVLREHGINDYLEERMNLNAVKLRVDSPEEITIMVSDVFRSESGVQEIRLPERSFLLRLSESWSNICEQLEFVIWDTKKGEQKYVFTRINDSRE